MVMNTLKNKPEKTMDTIKIRLFKCVILAKEADILRRRNNIELTNEHLEKNGGFKFLNATERTCVVGSEFFSGILGSKKRKFINPNYVRDTDVNINDDGEIDFRHDLPPERVLQLFLLQCIADSEMECRCHVCLSIAASNAAL